MYTLQNFTIPELRGISRQNIEEHLGLYKGYVTNTNHILEQLSSGDLDPYHQAELSRRFSFEFNGMKNHEYYFRALEGGAAPLDPTSALYQALEKNWGSYDAWRASFVQLAKTRGIGWAILSHDQDADMLIHHWVDEQHVGHLNSNQYILGIDMWEHAYVADYQPSGKATYIEDYLDQVNWKTISDRFEKLRA
ncbi:MAG: Fe-Mn family superoxide dismutase [Candidatus Pacebacteria bacterium]|nr:Fe-Mn family superoxide dismutase [Candidatus Paceibacterota bacterium]MCD8508105.1 Fe-Mn family superoxide dismutase [Candidatus Paceibacterota bacterium]MCD8528097.1 Fe-Mn family superoxide dismutase [Candidatus Paceibacterota bacterium]MCD8563740.1 Fe-Mn family superoxide dismutase [Candidatus Paceibacterota bacterium]